MGLKFASKQYLDVYQHTLHLLSFKLFQHDNIVTG
jgi:hypothetical protein